MILSGMYHDTHVLDVVLRPQRLKKIVWEKSQLGKSFIRVSG